MTHLGQGSKAFPDDDDGATAAAAAADAAFGVELGLAKMRRRARDSSNLRQRRTFFGVKNRGL